MNFKNSKKILPLSDGAIAVANRNLELMFNIELKFAADTLLKLFNTKINLKI